MGKFKKFLNNKEKKTSDIEKDVTDPTILKQELEVLIKNLNKEKNLQASFILRDEDVSEVDDGGTSGEEDAMDEKKLEGKNNTSLSEFHIFHHAH